MIISIRVYTSSPKSVHNENKELATLQNILPEGGCIKTGWTNFENFKLLLYEGTNSLRPCSQRAGAGRIVCLMLAHNEHHKICNGWHSGMVAFFSINKLGQ